MLMDTKPILDCVISSDTYALRHTHTPLDDILLLLNSLAQRVTQCDLGEVLQGGVDGVADGVVKHTFHTTHQHLQPLYHGNDLDPIRTKPSVIQNQCSI